MGLLQNLGPGSVARLHTLDQSLRLLEELHEQLPRRCVHEKEYVNELFHHGAHLVGQANLTALFAEISDQTAKTLLAQVAIAFFVWDPLSLLVPGTHFERRYTAAVAAMRLAERVAESEGRSPLAVLKEAQPLHVCDEILFYTLLHMMRRPLAFLLPNAECQGPLATGVLASLRFDAGIQERRATSPHPVTGQPTPRMLLLQSQPLPAPTKEVEQALAAGGIDLLHFGDEEVSASFAGGERVLERLRRIWDWQALEELAGQNVH